MKLWVFAAYLPFNIFPHGYSQFAIVQAGGPAE